jgi:hypothetical protein
MSSVEMAWQGSGRQLHRVERCRRATAFTQALAGPGPTNALAGRIRTTGTLHA